METSYVYSLVSQMAAIFIHRGEPLDSWRPPQLFIQQIDGLCVVTDTAL